MCKLNLTHTWHITFITIVCSQTEQVIYIAALLYGLRQHHDSGAISKNQIRVKQVIHDTNTRASPEESTEGESRTMA